MPHRPFRFGVVAAYAPSGDAWIATARRAEQLGYATLLMPDRLGHLLSPIPALAVAAGVTQSLRLGTFVLAAGWRNPGLLAQEGATLDVLSGGRFELGLGAGLAGDDARRAGLPVDRAGARIDRLAETLGAVKAAWAGHEAPLDPSTATAAVPFGYLSPVQRPRPPILVAGGGKRLLALAAREADIISVGAGMDDLGEQALADRIGWIRGAAGDRFAELELGVNLVAVIRDGKIGPELRERLRTIFHVDAEQLVRTPSPFVLIGTPEQMYEQIVDYRERLGISYITLSADLMDAFGPVVERTLQR